MSHFFDSKIEYLKGVGPKRANLLNKELDVFTFGDLLQYYPFRYEDRSRVCPLNELEEVEASVQVRGRLVRMKTEGAGKKQRLVGVIRDETGEVELVWFKGIKFVQKVLQYNMEYTVFGKPKRFGSRFNFSHPEIEPYVAGREFKATLTPVYQTSELMKRMMLDSKALLKLQRKLLAETADKVHETLPSYLLDQYGMLSKGKALEAIHFPENDKMLQRAKARLKFEELFFVQLKLLREKHSRQLKFKGQVFKAIDTLTTFYKEHLPFDLTNAQKRVIKEIRKDVLSGVQMNRLLQGDVGSGKTIVAFIVMLMAVDNGAQACLMAPTEILSIQHYQGLKEFADMLGIQIDLLTGSTKTAKRREIHQRLLSGELHVLVGTHALLEDVVQFKNLGLCVIDEQHRFGVKQRSRLWGKHKTIPPHVLVMTATPIPRTLAMSLYGDLDVSVIDELPAGRKPIQTFHRFDNHRLRVFGFLRKEIEKGRQAYIVYPLIESSENMEQYKDLMDGHESICRAFPEYQVSIVHGRMRPEDKDYEMKRFAKNETKIMVATTVIEVGVNVPNASIMVIENAERFGLSQLHQLRGRVGRGAEQSYCVLMTNVKLSKDSRTRMETMCRTNNGFEIADVDLKLRGPGDISGTMQSGIADLKVADISKDARLLQEARACAQKMLDEDPELKMPSHANVKRQVELMNKHHINWGMIS